MNHQMRWK